MTPRSGTPAINVLVVEDSRVVRDYLVYALELDPRLRVMGTAGDGEEALAMVAEHRPDVILMDVILPGIDGFETTRRIMASTPVPIVVCTASTSFDEVGTAMRALEAGALMALRKPTGLADLRSDADCAALVDAVRLMSEVRVVKRWRRVGNATAASPSLAPAHGLTGAEARDVAVVAIGASTGGPPALATILGGLPADFPVPILIVQHIAEGFTKGFAEWLGEASGRPVHVARGGVIPRPGHVYVAPDDAHLRVGPRGELQVLHDAAQNGCRPSVGVLFRSIAERYGRRSIGILLTGMGRDGADELRLMADDEALTIAQDRSSCVVFGMPGEAIRLGAATHVLPPRAVADLLVTVTRSTSTAP